jgi:hypothetical protein
VKKAIPLLIICAVALARCGDWNQPIVPVLEDSIDELRSIKQITVTRLPHPATFSSEGEIPDKWEESGLEVSGVSGANRLRVLDPSEYTVGKPAPGNGDRAVAVTLNDTHRYAAVSTLFHITVAEPPAGYYKVQTKAGITGGVLTAVPAWAEAGQEVAVFVTPGWADGYAYKNGSFSVKYSSPPPSVEFADNGEGPFTFTMPECDVEIEAEFMEVAARLEAGAQGDARYYETLAEAFDAAASADGESADAARITLLRDVTLANGITVTGKVTLTAADNRKKTVSRGAELKNSPLFTVGAGAELSLDAGDSLGLVLDGGGITAQAALIRVTGGELAMGGRVTLKNNVNSHLMVSGGGVSIGSSGSFTMKGGEVNGNTAAVGGGVSVMNGGSFTMTGGEMSGNTTSESGGGVAVSGISSFTMEGGRISGNTANQGGGVALTGTGSFTMIGGEISGNGAAGLDGGGVFINGGKAVMKGGRISGNTANRGGGVFVMNTGSFTMIGGEISGNGATGLDGGGGVFINGGEVAVEGGRISGNNAARGGGVCVVDDGSFTMAGGEISGNGATGLDGGGVFIDGGEAVMGGGRISGNSANRGGGVSVFDGSFTMMGGKISGNTAVTWGGGIFTCGDETAMGGGSLTMTSGEVSGNKAESGGGVALLSASGLFTMTGGKISGNTATKQGGGVFLENMENVDSFTMTSGEISGNEAESGGGVAINYGRFTMTGDKISGNTATEQGGGVFLAGANCVFTMNNGEISNNSAALSGGGVCVLSQGAFFINGGVIYGVNNEPLKNTAGTAAACLLFGYCNLILTDTNLAPEQNLTIDKR